MKNSLQSLFEAEVDRWPERIAVSGYTGRLTYAELDRRANRLAHHLRALGVGPDTLVALCLPRTLDLVVAIVGIVKAGGAYVPLDPEHPPERLAFYIADSRARILVTTSELAATAPGAATMVCLDGDAEVIAAHPTTRPSMLTEGHHLAYVIYTSGSTGVPKGVQVTDRNVVRLFTATHHWFGFDETDVWTLFHSYAFDFSVWELWGALLYGGRVVVVPFALSRAPEQVAALICDEGVTVLNQTPSAFRRVGAALIEADRPNALRTVVFGGEALDFTSLRSWVARFGCDTPRLVNMYGITETTVHVTYRPLSAEDIAEARGSMIGVPIPDLSLHLRDEQFRPVAPGAIGEIYVAGAGVARGYLDRPDLNALRFVEIDGAPAYRSGDLARVNASGDLEYLGRIDDQVKIRGFRIELGEIAAALSEHPGLSDAAVIATREADPRIVAYCIAPLQRPAPAELRRLLATRLPDYMIPSAFVFVDALPLTVNGKLDRAALPPPDEEAQPFRAPEGATETMVAAVWQEVLGCGPVGRDENFIALGGQSIVAAAAISRIASACGVTLAFRDFLRAPTLADLARTIDASQAAAVPGPRRLSREQPLIASDAQRRLWLTWRLDPADVAYNETISIRLTEDVDPVAMRRALTILAQRHESLRTGFVERDGLVQQLIDPSPTLTMTVVDAADEADSLVRATELARQPFDLAQAPLWRALLMRLGDADWQLHVTLHHIVWDGLSEGVFLEELHLAYRAALKGQEPVLPDLPVQDADVAAWEREQQTEARLGPQIDYWKTRLSGELPILTLPGAEPRRAFGPATGVRIPLSFDIATVTALKALARQEDATLFHVLLAAIDALLHRYTGAEDIVVGTVVARRPRPEMERLIGCHVAPLALRVEVRNDTPFRALLRQVRDTVLEAQSHGDVPFERLIEELRPHRQPGVHPIFQAALALGPGSSGRPGWTARHYDVFSGAAKFDLSFLLDETGDGVAGFIEHRAGAIDPVLAQHMAGHLRMLVAGLLENPDAEIGGLPLLTASEHRELAGWTGDRLDFDRTLLVHDVFRRQAERHPDIPAVVFGDRVMTHAELDVAANRLAHRLQALGAGPDVLIGICLDRSPEAIVAIVAVLKAGAAFVPLDPTYPLERLVFMARDSAAPLIVTQRANAAKLSDSGARLVVIEDEAETLAALPGQRPVNRATATNLAYLIYTSGSTGQPKGVMIEHRGFLNMLHSFGQAYGLKPATRALQFSRMSFDASVAEIAMVLAAGGTLVMAPQEQLMGGRELTSLIRDYRVEWALFPTSVLALLDPAEVPLLTMVTSAGEACTAEVVDRWAPGRHFVNAFGPTEISVCSSWSVCRPGEGRPSIGRPVGNSEQWVVDGGGNPVPVGIAGELYIGGVGVARGYRDRPALTAERFVSLPWAADPAARYYRSGDLVKWRPDGTLDYLGRIDLQVKLRGFRIELGEIESALRRHADVADAAVTVREPTPGHRQLAAYIVPAAAAASSKPGLESDLRRHLEALLPDYMVPATFTAIEKMPVTPSGKVDRKALPAPIVRPPRVSTRPPLPRGGAPRKMGVQGDVAAVWREVLGLQEIPLDVPFFEIGGHSLALARVQSLLRERLSVDLDMLTLLRLQTVRKLAHHIGETSAKAPALPPAGRPVLK